MTTKFFNNENGNTLFEKLKGIAAGMGLNFHTFQAVSGFFRSSGYFKLRAELKDVQRIQILVGINIDNIFRKHNKAEFFMGDPEEARKAFSKDYIEDVKNAEYADEVENGILQLAQDLADGRVEMKMHPTRNLHAKFYLCLPKNHTPNTDGWVIMGSSNISDSGLGITSAPRYELNVAMKDYDDVAYCKGEFERLWNEGVKLSLEDINMARGQTHLGVQPTPFELYMKVLINTFGEQAEDDFNMSLPENIKDLKYQRDAVIQGYQMLDRHNGFFLADVVGLGKTVVAAMIAKRFAETNGKQTAILVIYPPAVESNWKETFKKFGLQRRTQFVSNGSLSKVLNEKGNYRAKEEFDLIIVDESHNFRRDNNKRYDELQRICKAPRQNIGLTGGSQKKIILISATAVNNYPSDLLSQILLFQDIRRCTIENIDNLQSYFSPHIERFNKIMRDRKKDSTVDVSGIDAIYSEIRKDVLEKITVRRTRRNILNDPEYKKDLEAQQIVFPRVSPPETLVYQMDAELNHLFWETLNILTKQVQYARYRAIEFLLPPYSDKYRNAQQVAGILTGVYQVHMVKRLESSFNAFKQSLKTFIRITSDMIEMFDKDQVLIIPELDVSSLLDKGLEIEKIVEMGMEKHGYTKDEIAYPAQAFKDEFRDMLVADRKILEELDHKWTQVAEDPKFDLFVEKLTNRLFDKALNPTGKLVVFSESVDTVDYLVKHLSHRLARKDILKVYSGNRDKLRKTIMECFDANSEKQSDEYNIVITSDVLAEGINLHRANVIVNYDTPWNASRLMQRIGRVNRIGSVADEIHNFMFYPSAEGNQAIALYENSLLKMQGFHSALGEDVQIYSQAEIVKDFKLFNSELKDDVDDTLELLREVRHFYAAEHGWYKRIKDLPLKSRVIRKGTKDETIAFISNSRKTAYFRIAGGKVEPLGFLGAAKLLKADISEVGLPFSEPMKTRHFSEVRQALEVFSSQIQNPQPDKSINLVSKDRIVGTALSFLRKCDRWANEGILPAEISDYCQSLTTSIQNGVFTNLQRAVSALNKEYKNALPPLTDEQKSSLSGAFKNLFDTYLAVPPSPEEKEGESSPIIVISETLVK